MRDARGSPPGRKLNPDRYNNEDFCYLTTVGRVTGRPHTIEIWFALDGQTLYMLSGGRGRSDWVKNLRRTPEVTVRIADERFEGHARVVENDAEDELARELLIDKYESQPGSLSNWRRTALPVAVELVSISAGQHAGF
jgi:deazaflavin-dependent oxidoreductase (nitroreductase family)